MGPNPATRQVRTWPTAGGPSMTDSVMAEAHSPISRTLPRDDPGVLGRALTTSSARVRIRAIVAQPRKPRDSLTRKRLRPGGRRLAYSGNHDLPGRLGL